MLFLAGADYGCCENAKWTRRYLLGQRRIPKKGDLTTPLVNPFFQKENDGLKSNISKPPFRAARPNKNGLVVFASAAIIKRIEPINR